MLIRTRVKNAKLEKSAVEESKRFKYKLDYKINRREHNHTEKQEMQFKSNQETR